MARRRSLRSHQFLPSAVFVFALIFVSFPSATLTMAATNDMPDEVIRRLSRNDATLTNLNLIEIKFGAAGAGRLAEALATNPLSPL